jgi:hypothetical protein
LCCGPSFGPWKIAASNKQPKRCHCKSLLVLWSASKFLKLLSNTNSRHSQTVFQELYFFSQS